MRILFAPTKWLAATLHTFLAIFFVCAPLSQASTPIVHEIPAFVGEATEEFRFWENQIKRALEDEELPIYWAKNTARNTTKKR